MSNVKIQGNASGTGTLTIAAPNTNTDRTLTLPDESGTLLTSASPVIAQAGVPAFSVTFQGTQSVTSNTITKVTLNTEQFDTDSSFSTSTYRFTPTVAGYYQFNFGVEGATAANTCQAVNALPYKNGSSVNGLQYVYGAYIYPTATSGGCSTGSVLIYMNGSTDYFELYGKVLGTTPSFSTAFLTGVLVRAA